MPTSEQISAARVAAEQKAAELKQAALEYHEFPTPGKLAVQPTKQMINQYPWLYERASPLSWKSKA